MNCPCQLHQSTPSVAPLHPWSWPTRPWARLHLDYAGPVQGKMILVMVDAHSKWIEAICTPNATSTAVIEELRTIFAQFGIPETVVTDNGTCFVSAEIEAFFKSNGRKGKWRNSSCAEYKYRTRIMANYYAPVILLLHYMIGPIYLNQVLKNYLIMLAYSRYSLYPLRMRTGY